MPPKVFLLPKPGQKTVTVSGKALTLLEQRYRIEKTKKPNLSFAAFISEAALMELERRNILKEAQFISVIGFEDNTLIVRDLRKSGQLIEVHIKNKKLKCVLTNNLPSKPDYDFVVVVLFALMSYYSGDL